MLVREKTMTEGYEHKCDTLIRRDRSIKIYLHDTQAHTIIREPDGSIKLEYIKYCPYCGQEIDAEERPTENR